MPRSRIVDSAYLIAATVPGASLLVSVLRHPDNRARPPSFDMDNYYLSNQLYALDAIRNGGEGLFWNALGNCGAPFFGEGSVGLLHPTNLLFLLLSPLDAMAGTLLFNLIVAGAGMYALCRALGASQVASVGGAIAFQLCNSSVHVTSWQPLVSSGYAWLPASLAAAERLFQSPSLRRAGILALTLTFLWLPGYPMTTLFAYQLIVLRVAWRLVETRGHAWWPLLAMLAIALVWSLALPAVQLVPAIDTAMRSVRAGNLPTRDLGSGNSTASLLRAMMLRLDGSNPLLLLSCVLAAAAFTHKSTRRSAVFLALTGLLYWDLSRGNSGSLFPLYRHLPFGEMFRLPGRFAWVTDLCIAAMAGLGITAVSTSQKSGSSGLGAMRLLAPPLAVGATLFFLVPGGLLGVEEVFLALTLAVMAVTILLPKLRLAGAAALVALLFIYSSSFAGSPFHAAPLRLATRFGPYLGIPHDLTEVDHHATILGKVKARMSPQDRAYLLITQAGKMSFNSKTPMVHEIPSLQDYATQISRRYADLFSMMRLGYPAVSLAQSYYGGALPYSGRFRVPLLNLLAGRFLVVESKRILAVASLKSEFRQLLSNPELLVFENPRAIPRASFVPRAEVVPSQGQLLLRLASDEHDPRKVALLEAAPDSGFVGTEGQADGASTAFSVNDPEHVVVSVDAPKRGFLHLADQYAPGWRAWVDGHEMPIYLANHAFRLVEVPAGKSRVEFRYTPPGFVAGAAISALSTLLLLGTWLPVSLRTIRRP